MRKGRPTIETDCIQVVSRAYLQLLMITVSINQTFVAAGDGGSCRFMNPTFPTLWRFWVLVVLVVLISVLGGSNEGTLANVALQHLLLGYK
jgi:hypothetical protein